MTRIQEVQETGYVQWNRKTKIRKEEGEITRLDNNMNMNAV